ncbi:tRNA uridine-5-carboxymethylaminomethyl(34) synthesis GTPase MnmE [Devosia sp. D6-9]|nr:tRNA uridine-5-carboxymethylaminomethyl(34) synthesis GTPase MnmE [Devosia sp. D6-9]
MREGDTIVALSTGSLPSGVAVIRLSGPATPEIVQQLRGAPPKPRFLHLTEFKFKDEVLDSGLLVFFPAPRSFTGEDCAELQVHGSPAVVRAILRALTEIEGVRLAEAGEFTRRAFENGKLDLTEVEGLGDLLEAETESQRRQAVARAAGGLSDKLGGWRETLLDLRAEIEARLDFSDEGDVSNDLPPDFSMALQTLRGELRSALENVSRGRIVREGVRVALAGAPNAGKSSLLNALAKSELAIVTDEPGTTRDVRDVAIDLNGQLVIIVDMAGLRETDSKAEAEGVRRARAELEIADLVMWLQAPDGATMDPPPTSAPIWRVATKADLAPGSGDISISTRTGDGLDALTARLSTFSSDLAGQGEPSLVSRERDRQGLSEALAQMEAVAARLEISEITAEQLRLAGVSLERLLGRIDTEMVLDRLFSAFCIGK